MMRGFYNNYYGWGGGPDIFSFIFMILFWILVICAIVALVKSIKGHSEDGDKDEEESLKIKKENKYLEIVKDRYAKGEIDKKEFEQLKRDLG